MYDLKIVGGTLVEGSGLAFLVGLLFVSCSTEPSTGPSGSSTTEATAGRPVPLVDDFYDIGDLFEVVDALNGL